MPNKNEDNEASGSLLFPIQPTWGRTNIMQHYSATPRPNRHVTMHELLFESHNRDIPILSLTKKDNEGKNDLKDRNKNKHTKLKWREKFPPLLYCAL